MDALTLGIFLSPILTVTTVWNTGETGDIHDCCILILCPARQELIKTLFKLPCLKRRGVHHNHIRPVQPTWQASHGGIAKTATISHRTLLLLLLLWHRDLRI